MEAFVENQRRWNRERNIIAAESRLKAIDRMEKIDKPKNLPSQIKFRFETDENVKTPHKLLEVTGLAKAYPKRSCLKIFPSYYTARTVCLSSVRTASANRLF